MSWIRRMGRGIIPLLFIYGSLAGCDSLPSDLEKRAATYEQRYDELETQIANRAAAFTGTQSSNDWSFYQPYAVAENWEQHFATATTELERAAELYKQKVSPLLDADRSADAPLLTAELDRIDQILKDADESSRAPANRMHFLADAKANAGEWITKAREQMKEINSIINAVAPVVRKAKADYPQRTKDIDGVYAPLTQMQSNAADALTRAEAQHVLHERGGNTDYATLGDSTTLVKAKLDELQRADTELREKLGQLYESHTKILADMRTEYWVTVGRTSWDNAVDWPTEHEYQYPPTQVDAETFNYLANEVGGTTLATYGCFFGCGTEVKIKEEAWNKLGVKPQQSWPTRSDDAAEYWLADWEPRYFHKYLLVQNGQREETDWVAVDEEDYADYVGALGMEIESKPYGAFASETLADPTPPGMSKVGNPAYGEWKNDSSGNSFWHFYGQYAFLNALMGGGPGYYRADYNDYRSWRSRRDRDWGYYGRNSANPSYGTYGSTTRTNPRWQNTTFNRTGGFQRADASVRGAGPSSRGRGPGGGGK